MKISYILFQFLLFNIVRLQAQTIQVSFGKAYSKLQAGLKSENPSFLSSLINVETADSDSLRKKVIAEYKKIILDWKIANLSSSVNEEALNQAIFHFLKDTTKFQFDNQVISHPPFTYNHDDPAGKADWTNTFVTKLLVTHTGNCKSLSYLYKILADELGAKCWLALAPGHIYIKNYSKALGWYNTELTSGTFPNNGWIMASGYVTLDAIKSGMYMDTLSNQQAVAGLAVDLALGYIHTTGIQADSFVLKCCDLTLQYHAVNSNALLLKAETMKRMYLATPDTSAFIAKEWYATMEQLYVRLYKLGYRQMPESMYQQWLQTAGNYPTKSVKQKHMITILKSK